MTNKTLTLLVATLIRLVVSSKEFHSTISHTTAFVSRKRNAPSKSVQCFARTTNEATKAVTTDYNYVNSEDNGYPWQFNGRAILCPMLVRTSTSLGDRSTQNKLDKWNILPWSLFGWTIGGTVALEYDDSPVGPYTEFVRLGCLASTLHAQPSTSNVDGESSFSLFGGSKRLTVGQMGTKLFVNESIAMDLCEKVWDMTAFLSDDNIAHEHRTTITAVQMVDDELPPASAKSNVNSLTLGSISQFPLLWTPTITTIWAQILPRIPTIAVLQNKEQEQQDPFLPLNRLRLSTKVKLVTSPEIRNSKSVNNNDEIPLGFGVALCALKIEISPRLLD